MTKKLRAAFFFFFPFFVLLLTFHSVYAQKNPKNFRDSLAYFNGIYRGEGWRLITVPAKRPTFSALFSGLWIQGVGGSDVYSGKATFFRWEESQGGNYMPIKKMSNKFVPGKGYLVYMFEDDEQTIPGTQEGSLKVRNTKYTVNKGIVRVPVTANDVNGSGSINNLEGWNLLGNPFSTSISVGKVLDALEIVNVNVNQHLYVWNPSANNGNGDFETRNVGEFISPFQAFFIRYTQKGVNGTVTLNKNVLKSEPEADFYDHSALQNTRFKVFLGDGKKYDEYTVRFSTRGKLNEDLYDVYKLFSLNPHSINLFSTLGEGTKLAVNVIPEIPQLKRKISISLRYQLPESGKYTFRWNETDNLPEKINIFLIDGKTGAKINVRKRRNYSFSYSGHKKKNYQSKRTTFMLNETADVQTEPRFRLMIAPERVAEKPDKMAKPVVLHPNYPNPFRNRTEMSFKLKEAGPVSITIWNIVGQKVATIYDHKMMSKGTHYYYWRADNDLPSGIYICKLEAAGTVVIRKMTLIK